MISLEIGLPSIKVEQYNEPCNSKCQRSDLDLLPKVRQQAQVRMAAYRQRIVRNYNAKVKPKVFRPEDLVLRKAEVSKPLDQKKLSPNWERFYRIIETLRSDAYRLKIFNETTIPRT